MSVQSEARELLWGAVPQRLGDNRKSWFAHAASVLGWTPRRVRAVFNGEARRIDAHELRQLEARYELQQQRAAQREKDRHDLRVLLQGHQPPVPLAERALGCAGRQPIAGDQPVGARQSHFPFLDHEP